MQSFVFPFSVIISVVTDLYILYLDAQRALELLQQYRAQLDQRQQNQSQIKQGLVEEDHQLHQSLDRVINVFQSQLFSALLGKDIGLFIFPVTVYTWYCSVLNLKALVTFYQLHHHFFDA